jgi:hypothetical protein
MTGGGNANNGKNSNNSNNGSKGSQSAPNTGNKNSNSNGNLGLTISLTPAKVVIACQKNVRSTLKTFASGVE